MCVHNNLQCPPPPCMSRVISVNTGCKLNTSCGWPWEASQGEAIIYPCTNWDASDFSFYMFVSRAHQSTGRKHLHKAVRLYSSMRLQVVSTRGRFGTPTWSERAMELQVQLSTWSGDKRLAALKQLLVWREYLAFPGKTGREGRKAGREITRASLHQGGFSVGWTFCRTYALKKIQQEITTSGMSEFETVVV